LINLNVLILILQLCQGCFHVQLVKYITKMVIIRYSKLVIVRDIYNIDEYDEK